MTKQAEVSSRWPNSPALVSVGPGLVCGVWCCTGLDEVTVLSRVDPFPRDLPDLVASLAAGTLSTSSYPTTNSVLRPVLISFLVWGSSRVPALYA